VQEYLKFFIGGDWVDPAGPETRDVIDPATEQPVASIAMGTAVDVDRAVAAARAAFPAFSATTAEERADLLDAVSAAYKSRGADIAEAITAEMGAPGWLAKAAQMPAGMAHYATAAKLLRTFPFEEVRRTTLIRKEPIGVCGLITPWNWPANQIACKVAPALAAGCMVVLKPSELAPLDALILAEIMAEVGVPAGVFNLVNGDGVGVGEPLAAHPDVDMISFTGSNRAGVLVAQAAAPTVKRVAQELGGKSANIILPDADVEKAVARGVAMMMTNTGQSCNAPSRMFVPADRNDDAKAAARSAAEKVQVMMPADADRGAIGPIANAAQFERVQAMIASGIEEGATLVAGGPGRPEGLNSGYFARPTVFADATNDMTIAREEIFGPVLVMIPYKDEDDAVAKANDSPYGLSGYVQSGSTENARRVARRLRTGNVHLNGAQPDFAAPFGGYKRSGNGREWGVFGLEEFLEAKAVMGWEPDQPA